MIGLVEDDLLQTPKPRRGRPVGLDTADERNI